jgi:hypothetical protein
MWPTCNTPNNFQDVFEGRGFFHKINCL